MAASEKNLVWRCYVCGEIGFGEPQVLWELWSPAPQSLGRRLVPVHKQCEGKGGEDA